MSKHGRPAQLTRLRPAQLTRLRPFLVLRAWGRGEDHVAAVAIWRLCGSCGAELVPHWPQLVEICLAPQTRAAMLSVGWGGRRTDGR
eukprot:COSAG01_NODE_13_length_41723_cov_145.394556_8_plen_87_part_00